MTRPSPTKKSPNKNEDVLDKESVKKLRSQVLASLRSQARGHKDRLIIDAEKELFSNEFGTAPQLDSAQLLADLVLDSVRDVVSPVIASFGVETSLNLSKAKVSRPNGWVSVETDYKQISVTIDPAYLPHQNPEAGHLGEFLDIVKGLVYHELGHILYSMPLSQIVDLRSKVTAPDNAQSEPTPDGNFVRNWAYALLDDQRMESALTAQSPVLGAYLAASVHETIIDPAAVNGQTGTVWPFICGRTHLPQVDRDNLRQEALDFAHSANLVSELHEIEKIVDLFNRATRAHEMRKLLDRAIPPLRSWFAGQSTFAALQYSRHQMGDPSRAPKGPRPIPTSKPEAEPELQELTQSSLDFEIDDENKEPTQKSKTKRGLEAESGTPTSVKAAGLTDNQPTRNVEPQQTTSQTEVNDLIRAFNTGLERNMNRNRDVRPMTAHEVRASNRVRVEMLDLLFPLLSQSEPSWQFRQDHGILDPVSYRLREPGTLDYWSSQEGPGSPGPELAVSLLLDISGSMGEFIDDLFVAAIGVRKACDELEVPCTLVTFAGESQLLFDVSDQTKEVIALCQGSTYPRGAFEDLHKQQNGREHHLVIIFTDGHWADINNLNAYCAPGRILIGVTNDRSMLSYLRTLGFNETVFVENCSAFATTASEAIVPYFV